MDLSTSVNLTLFAALLSIVVKELLYRVTYQIGKKADSQATMANAYHHRTDAMSSVVALIGIAAARVGVIFGYNLAWCDPCAGLLVAVFICKAGWQVARFTVLNHNVICEALSL